MNDRLWWRFCMIYWATDFDPSGCMLCAVFLINELSCSWLCPGHGILILCHSCNILYKSKCHFGVVAKPLWKSLFCYSSQKNTVSTWRKVIIYNQLPLSAFAFGQLRRLRVRIPITAIKNRAKAPPEASRKRKMEMDQGFVEAQIVVLTDLFESLCLFYNVWSLVWTSLFPSLVFLVQISGSKSNSKQNSFTRWRQSSR